MAGIGSVDLCLIVGSIGDMDLCVIMAGVGSIGSVNLCVVTAGIGSVGSVNTLVIVFIPGVGLFIITVAAAAVGAGVSGGLLIADASS